MTVMRNSSWTGRAPRSAEQAFGPYNRNQVVAPDEPMHRNDRIVVAASLIAAVVFIVIVFAEVLS